jgi:hypothetical protein
MKKTYSLLTLIIITLFISDLANLQQINSTNKIPVEYKLLYEELDRKLDDIGIHIDTIWNQQKYKTSFCTSLLAANSNRGEDLLKEKTLKSVSFTLDRLKELGVKGIVFNIAYPLLMNNFPRSAEYLEFYKKVAKEVKSRNLVLIIETGLIFTEPEVSSLNVNYSDLTIEKYTKYKRYMAETIIKEIKPDYLTVENEPGTQHHICGLDFSVENYSESLKYILKDLDKKGVYIGAGAGSWDNIDYFKASAENPLVDYIDIHIYPIQRNYVIDKCEKVYELAKEHNKMLACTECWLYKIADSELGEVSSETYLRTIGRDPYSFWSPLDQKFIGNMYKLSNYLQFEFCSFFWTQYFYGYFDYTDAIDKLGYTEKMQLSNKNAASNILSGTLSETGSYFQELIK